MPYLYSQTAPAEPQAIVGVPVSPRALDGLEHFLSALLPDTGAAYLLLVQGEWAAWLAPQLHRIVPLPVLTPFAEDSGAAPATVTLQRDCIYLLPSMNISTGASGIPAGACWHLAHGRLYSGPPIVEAAPDESWDDADRFFGRLGQEFGPRAVAAVLSGTGEVGPGLQAVRAAGGRVLVQAPETAQYVQLPLSALESGAADTVLGAGELAIYLSAVLPGSSELTREQFALLDMPQPPEPLRGRPQAITDEVERQTGCDFGHYRWTSVLRHIERRMHHLPLGGRGATLEDYLAWLQRTPEEGAQLRHRMVANATCFFRDSSAWAALGRELRQNLAQELAEHAAGATKKARSPGNGAPGWWAARAARKPIPPPC